MPDSDKLEKLLQSTIPTSESIPQTPITKKQEVFEDPCFQLAMGEPTHPEAREILQPDEGSGKPEASKDLRNSSLDLILAFLSRSRGVVTAVLVCPTGKILAGELGVETENEEVRRLVNDCLAFQRMRNCDLLLWREPGQEAQYLFGTLSPEILVVLAAEGDTSAEALKFVLERARLRYGNPSE